jgi:lipopolysaccharide exporter
MYLFTKLHDIKQRPLFSGIFSLGRGTAIGQFAVILSTPILSRMYVPEDMGILSLLVAFMGFASISTGLRYEIAIVSADDDQEAGLLTCGSFLLSIPVAALCCMILLGMIRFGLLSYDLLPNWSVPIIGCLLVIVQLFMSLRYWFVRRSDFSIIGQALIVQGIGRAVVPIIAGFMSMGWMGLFMGEVAGRIFGIRRMLRASLISLISIARDSSWKMFFYMLRKYIQFPSVVLPSSLIDALGATLPFPIILYLYGSGKAGLFFMVVRLGTLPASFISASIADVLHSKFSKDYYNDPHTMRPFLVSTVKKLFMTGCCIYIPIAVLSPFLFGMIFGERWAPAGIVMTLLAPIGLLGMVVSPLSRILLVVNRMGIKLLADIVCLVLPFLGIFVSYHYRGNFELSIAVYSLMYIIANLFYFQIIWKATPR